MIDSYSMNSKPSPIKLISSFWNSQFKTIHYVQLTSKFHKLHTSDKPSFPFLLSQPNSARLRRGRDRESEGAGENWINASRQLGGCKLEIKIAFRVVCHPDLPRSAGGKLITWRGWERVGEYLDCCGPQSRQTGKGHDGFPFPYMKSGGRVRGGGTAIRPQGREREGSAAAGSNLTHTHPHPLRHLPNATS